MFLIAMIALLGFSSLCHSVTDAADSSEFIYDGFPTNAFFGQQLSNEQNINNDGMQGDDVLVFGRNLALVQRQVGIFFPESNSRIDSKFAQISAVVKPTVDERNTKGDQATNNDTNQTYERNKKLGITDWWHEYYLLIVVWGGCILGAILGQILFRLLT